MGHPDIGYINTSTEGQKEIMMKADENMTLLQEEIRSNYTISTAMKQLWAVQLDLIAALDRVCCKYNLNYFAAGGTLIGAVRHQGYIPWDDDVDIVMFRNDFEKLKQVAPYEFLEPYFLQTEESDPDIYLGGYSKLRNSNTTFIEYRHLGRKANLGVWIDIFVLDYSFEDKASREKQIHEVRFYQQLLYAKNYGSFSSLLGLPDIEWNYFKKLSDQMSREVILKRLHAASTACHESQLMVSFSYLHIDQYWPLLFDERNYHSFITMDFEWMKIPIPVGYNNLLTTEYGQHYMEFPSLNERKPKHQGIIDPFKPYVEYVSKFNHAFEQIENKTIVIFGAGHMFQNYMIQKADLFPPSFVVDNDKSKWGTKTHGIVIQPPEVITTIPREQLRLIVCNIHYQEIALQLTQMGIDEYYFYSYVEC
jgi:lipopolysaccharide cholinephosphotransferase